MISCARFSAAQPKARPMHEEALQAEGWEGILAPGEALLWQGQPNAQFDFWGEGPLAVAFGMTLTGGVLVPMATLAAAIGPGALIFLPVLIVGLWLLLGKAAWRSYRLARTWYSITSARVFLATAVFGRRQLHSMPITSETEISALPSTSGGLLLRAPEGYALQLERLPERARILALLHRVQHGAKG